MELFIVYYNRGNRRVHANSKEEAWQQVCPNDTNLTFVKLDSKTFAVNKGQTRIGQIKQVPKGCLCQRGRR